MKETERGKDTRERDDRRKKKKERTKERETEVEREEDKGKKRTEKRERETLNEKPARGERVGEQAAGSPERSAYPGGAAPAEAGDGEEAGDLCRRPGPPGSTEALTVLWELMASDVLGSTAPSPFRRARLGQEVPPTAHLWAFPSRCSRVHLEYAGPGLDLLVRTGMWHWRGFQGEIPAPVEDSRSGRFSLPPRPQHTKVPLLQKVCSAFPAKPPGLRAGS